MLSTGGGGNRESFSTTFSRSKCSGTEFLKLSVEMATCFATACRMSKEISPMAFVSAGEALRRNEFPI